ncbi:DUF6901 family protein [Propionivibrio dicarboxylicus]|uniref:Uncharacterized protein n=1 Tax=Propionivibrio dicarboxylicus TaxID=83767 RepID=A0A1G8IVX5_9RHOO|nr:hypothetical protein [Propionivibrio dicarboxylicus]SDI22952.1 hypothetical protein SAMN05660652_03062 [Propionivibrio dicarboxylicus]
METWRIDYRFILDNAPVASFPLVFDAATMRPLTPLPTDAPAWCRLDCQRCAGCRQADDTPFCPAALRLAELLAWSQHLDSWRPLHLEVRAGGRTTTVDTTAQRAVSSLMGLLIATSGCPDTEFLRPMARFHQPVADEIETAFRAVSTCLLAQYVAAQAGRRGDETIDGLRARYGRLHDINRALCDRLRNAVDADSIPNAMIILDCFAKAVPGMIDDALSELAGLFEAYPQDLPGA